MNRIRREDSILVQLCAEPPAPSPDLAGLDWGYLLRVSGANRLDGLLFNALDRLQLLDAVPSGARTSWENRYRKIVETTSLYLGIAADLAERFRARGLHMIVLRGPALGLTAYEKPYLRPFHDLDLLIPRKEIASAKEALSRAGFAPEPGLLPDVYFEKHHLHLRRTREDSGAVVELHWALDHPYTLDLVDYPALFRRALLSPPGDVRLPVLDPIDSLVTLCLHFRKHCLLLPAMMREEDFISLLLREGVLLWLADIQRARRKMDEASLREAGRRAGEWNLREQFDSCLQAADPAFQGGRPPRGGETIGMGLLSRIVARRRIAFLRGEGGRGRLERFLFGLRPDSIFRPVRALELARFVFPPPEYLRRRYGRNGRGGTRIRHAARAVGRLAENLTDYLCFRSRGKTRTSSKTRNHED
ncbi:MAG: nucleotidyltransferase family protein [Candidatus Aureabacteria bacterium]|nr:nucleotidyltransferase family protein [Candidatus Auribacterota bacterium]